MGHVKFSEFSLNCITLSRACKIQLGSFHGNVNHGLKIVSKKKLPHLLPTHYLQMSNQACLFSQCNLASQILPKLVTPNLSFKRKIFTYPSLTPHFTSFNSQQVFITLLIASFLLIYLFHLNLQSILNLQFYFILNLLFYLSIPYNRKIINF